MPLYRTALPSWIAVLSLFTGCANVPLTETGFLKDYSELAPAPEAEVWGIPDTVHLFRSGALDAGGYDAVLVEPAVWVPSPADDFEPSEAKMAWLLEEFSDCLKKGLGEDFEVVDEARPGALRVRPALTAINPQNVPLNLITVLLVLPVDMGGISGEIEVLDALTGERVLAISARREGNPFLWLEIFTVYGHARHGMWKWSRMLAAMLQPTGQSADPPTR
ncbi:MAG: hypothetical protein ACI8QZ_001778 [Chlamydiales bacterium]|jgi:hypothetical protein